MYIHKVTGTWKSIYNESRVNWNMHSVDELDLCLCEMNCTC